MCRVNGNGIYQFLCEYINMEIDKKMNLAMNTPKFDGHSNIDKNINLQKNMKRLHSNVYINVEIGNWSKHERPHEELWNFKLKS